MRLLLNIIVLIVSADICAGSTLYDPSILKEGDIIFQESVSEQAKALKLATKSRYSHVAILFRRGNEWYVEEAVQPVKYTKLSEFIRRGKGNHYVVKRLINADEVLSPEKIDEMKKLGKTFLGRNYDPYFEWDDRRIYCTELVWKIYHEALNVEIGKLERLGDFDLTSPYVKRIMRKRYGNRIPFDEIVISPKSMFEAGILKTVVVYN
jgi:hypothetical protein